MKEIKRDAIKEVPRYEWECLKCGEINEELEDQAFESIVVCEKCRETFELID